MSNLEKEPLELLEEAGPRPAGRIELLEPRDVPLGGPRAMNVRRTLPQRSRSLIGAWCFVDHYGPDLVAERGGMVVPPHPHTGLQTVSWLFAGEIDHRDSVGSHALVRPGELNLMTAGSGIAHSEVSTDATTVLHGAQLWLALPDATRHTAPAFEHYAPPALDFDGATVRVFLGSLLGSTSPALAFSPIVGAQIDLPAFASVDLPVDAAFEHGVLLDTGSVAVDGEDVPLGHLAYRAPASSTLRLVAGPEGARLLLIGGTPFGESIIMWWNFIGRTHDEVVRFRTEWQADVVAGARDDGRFGVVAGYPGRPLPAPELPGVRLKPRG
ncbi:redox-sensitive bicupin YhaK (pirin superfamily) [Conyzicola lurida]|uniref:Redox-sensitive bicupin YhaK (Pirin superfamily) n=1 Tax=Conyzicola lurida TaxID=1172621 RepID=A0A841AUV7_9MICO|nr:pirin family protein [Conyzicola lurida]MBB5845199.1 redox-sensitive bicupin YhaK (pirin superfamily) [Conyzicola lurida]